MKKKKREYSYAFIEFRKWITSDNVIHMVEGWRTQCSQYTILFKTRKALYKYFKKEYIN